MEAYLAILIGTIMMGAIFWLIGWVMYKIIQKIFDPLIEWAESRSKSAKRIRNLCRGGAAVG